MKRNFFGLIVFLFIGISVKAQDRKWEDIDSTGYFKKTLIKNKGLHLTFIVKDSLFDNEVGKRMIDLFFKVYPKILSDFNPAAAKEITFVIDPKFNGGAGTIGSVIKYNAGWIKLHPQDIDMVTHELMHIVQEYGYESSMYLTEGIADYVRYRYGVNNQAAGWALPDPIRGQGYKNGYTTTARFLVWLESHHAKGIVKALDTSLREKRYSPEIWIQIAGKSPEELWEDYLNDPKL